MTRKILIWTAALVFVVLSAPSISHAEGNSFWVHGGISKAVGNGSEYWKLGHSFGGTLLFRITSNFLFGGRVALNKWAPNESELTKEYRGLGIDWNVTGSASILEVVPTIRIVLVTSEAKDFNVFYQLGMGLFRLNLDVTAEAYYSNQKLEMSIRDQDYRHGLSLGAGFTLGKRGSNRFEFLPLFHFVYTEGEQTRYFSVNVGVSIE